MHIVILFFTRLEILFEYTRSVFVKENLLGVGRLRQVKKKNIYRKREIKGENSHQLDLTVTVDNAEQRVRKIETESFLYMSRNRDREKDK